jgi:hypothetical protein
LKNVTISGDFFCYPAGGVLRLESELEARMTSEIREVIEALYFANALEIPGVAVEDWLAVFSG